MSQNNDTERAKAAQGTQGVPETADTEPASHRTGGPTVHDYSAAETLAEEGLPEGEESKDVAALKAEIAQLKDKMLRAVAEAENVRRRAEREKADATKFGITRLARDLMGVADNFERALATVPSEERENVPDHIQNLLAGLEMTEQELVTAFEKNGIRRIEPQRGARFDPNFHQAVAEIPSSDQPGGTVVHLTQTGYLLDDRVLRPAMVTVARAQPGGQTPGSGEVDSPDSAGPGSTINTTA